jgi:mono/diheme cytochrome c family protein
MTASQRAAATRAFLGLGAVPDRAAGARGAPLFVKNCAFCHGPSGRGATGPALITSDLVLADDHGEHLMPFLKKGRPEKGMPEFATMSDQELTEIAEFLHVQVEDVANRGAYQVLNILIGNAAKGEAYVEGHCMSCHTPETFAHIASRFRSPSQLQRYWIWPAGVANITANVKTQQGMISGRVTQMSDFRITVVDGSGDTRTIDSGPGVEVQINDQLAAHQKMVMTLGNDDMHNVTAYLETLK